MAAWSSIPGETPIDDLSGLKIKGISTRPELSAAEARNILRATIRYLAATPTQKQAPFDLAWVKKLHREMFGEVWDWAGSARTTQTNIGVAAHSIESELAILLDDLAVWCKSDMPVLEQSARLHHRAVLIHPFVNGNGRWARMLADIWLMQRGEKPIRWPADIDGNSPVREEYLDALRCADAHDLEPLLELYRRLSLTS